ncbi:unnamed protein product [Haemonchus placei]|uniref:Lipoprotein n=1 Tax=Haemonchus placei TaxID=6290 RepID=A0A0N4X0J0_HAEPC|nr:unnamed protein product [Haemonchus placei]
MAAPLAACNPNESMHPYPSTTLVGSCGYTLKQVMKTQMRWELKLRSPVELDEVTLVLVTVYGNLYSAADDVHTTAVLTGKD